MNHPPVSKISDFQRTTLLVIEDNPDHLFLIKSTLSECMPGINAVGVNNAEAALEYLAAQKGNQTGKLPKLILADLYLPSREEGILALQAVRELSKSLKLPPIPVVMFSHSDQKADIGDCYDSGANAYMIKSPDYREWADYFTNLKEFWLETVSLPQLG